MIQRPQQDLTSQPDNGGFTIVELLVVIVVIGILAAITIVAYTGISQKAIASSLQSDLTNASTQLKMFQVENSAYPAANNCPTPGVTEICLKFSPGNTFVGYSASNQSNSQTFLLIANNGNIAYRVTNNSAPTQLASTMQPGVTLGAILELHAAKANDGTSPGINTPLTTTWKDTSGNGNNGTLTGFGGETPWVGAGTVGDPYRLVYDASDDAVSVADAVELNSESTTLEQWVLTGGVEADFFLVSKDYHSRLIRQWTGSFYGLTYAFSSTTTGWYERGLTSNVPLPSGIAHGVVTHDAASGLATLYINGVACGVLTGVGSLNSSGNSIFLGGGGLFAAHGVAATRIYPFALTPEQVAQNYAAGPDW